MVSLQYEAPGVLNKVYTVGSAPSYTLYTYSYIPFLNEKVALSYTFYWQTVTPFHIPILELAISLTAVIA